MKHPDFSIFPEINTLRLKLRKLADTDAQKIHELRSSPIVNAFIDRDISTGTADALAFIKKITDLIQNNKAIYWVITLNDEPALIGTIGLWNFDIPGATIEIGYELLPQYHGKGLMTEVIKSVINYGFNEMEAETITAFTDAGNISSVKLLISNGFKPGDRAYDHSNETDDNMITYLLKRPINYSI
jgi:ribosomal-protein-alanine N-acetyltransferase